MDVRLRLLQNLDVRVGMAKDRRSLDDAQMKAFEDLRQRLLKAPILALPRHGAPYKLDTDACAYQVGCCLLQEQEDNTWHPIGYFSRSLTDAERNYSASERECLAVVWGVLMLRPYLLGTQFTVRTDYHALRWLLNLTDVSGRLARWRLHLAKNDFEVEYRPGMKHQLADGMSRLRTGDDPEEIEDEIPTFAVETDGGELTISDPTYVRAIDADEQISGYFLPPEPERDRVCTLEEQTDVVPVTADELLTAQAEDPFCQEKANSVGDPKSQFEFDRYGFLVRKSRLDGTWAKVPASPPRSDSVPCALHAPLWSSGRHTDVFHAQKGVLLAADGKRCLCRGRKLRLLCTSTRYTLQGTEVLATISRFRSSGVRCNGYSR